MNETIEILVDGASRRVDAGASLAAALLNLGVRAFRYNAAGEPGAPVCGMGTCFECRVTVDGVTGVRSCLEGVQAGMVVDTGTSR
ncbi:MAG: 2Fe-2S iron-sulfur cluster-binding protein [Gemmatimonadales bacterium]